MYVSYWKYIEFFAIIIIYRILLHALNGVKIKKIIVDYTVLTKGKLCSFKLHIDTFSIERGQDYNI